MNGPTPPLAVPGYQLMNCLGEGAFGVVYQARQQSTGQWVAVKLLRAQGVSPGPALDRLKARFARETSLCAQLHHPHIVRLLDKGQAESDTLFAVFEYVPGTTLRDLIVREGPLPAPQAGALMLQVLDALAAAHAQGIVHRDLKPMNIMVSGSGARLHAKVLDFGLGTLVSDLGQLRVRDLTLSSEIMGTPRYCAPEQLRGEPPTIKSDLYAWGLTLLECLTGRPAIHGASLAEVYHQHLSADEIPLPPAMLQQPIGALLRGVLRKDPARRGPLAAELHERAGKINWSGIVGPLQHEETAPDDPAIDTTQIDAASQERRQIAMLGFSLETADDPARAVDAEALETWLKHEVDRCQDTCAAHGGYLAGSFGTLNLVYFGYPEAHEGAARHAARAALELVANTALDAPRFEALSGAALQARVALHTVVVVARAGQVPMGIDATALARQVLRATPGQVTVSPSAKPLLDRHFSVAEDDDTRTGAMRFVLGEQRNDTAPDSVPDDRQRLVGREQELLRLTELWHQVRAGRADRPGLVLEGDPGIGKSRLAAALCEQVRRDRGSAWVLQCLPEHRNAALHPFLRWLRGWLQPAGDASSPAVLQDRLQALVAGNGLSVAEVVPITCAWLGLPLPSGLAPVPHAPGRQKKIMLDSLIRLLHGLARGPLLLVVEDIHWVDPTSRELLDRLLAGDGGPALGVLMTARPDSDYRPATEVLALRGLNDHDAETLLRGESQGGTPSPVELARLVSRAGGNPLFLTELIRGQGAARARTGKTSEDVPASLRDVLGQFLDTLGPAKETAQLAAAIGREFEHRILRAASSKAGPALQHDIEQLVAAGLLQHVPSADADTYTFRHALLRDAAYDALTRSLRQQAHGRIAEVLARRTGTRPSDLAYHHAGAGVYDKAVACMTEAARTALERSLYEEARAMCDQALVWNRLRTDSGLECSEAELATNRILLPAVSALRGLGHAALLQLNERNAALIEIVGRQRPDAAQAARTEQLWRKECLDFQAIHFSGDCARTIRLGEDLLSRLREKGLRQPQLQVLPLLAQAYHWTGDLLTAEARFHQALDLYRPDEDRTLWVEHVLDPRCQSLFLLSHTLAYQGKADEARRCLEDCLDWATEVRCINAADGAVFFEALADYLVADVEAINAAAVAHEAAHANATEDQWLVAGWRMVHDWANGRPDHTRRFIDGSLQAGAVGAMCWFEAMLADTEMSQGQAEPGMQRLRQGIERCQRLGEVATLPIQYTVLARGSLLADGQMSEAAERYFETALAISHQHGSHALGLLAAVPYAQALARQQRTDKAREVLSHAMSRLSEGLGTPIFRQARACLDALPVHSPESETDHVPNEPADSFQSH